MAENREIAKEVIQAIGGQENIASFAHCATRLRIMVHDKEKIDQKKLRRSTRSRVLSSIPGNIRLFLVQVR